MTDGVERVMWIARVTHDLTLVRDAVHVDMLSIRREHVLVVLCAWMVGVQ